MKMTAKAWQRNRTAGAVKLRRTLEEAQGKYGMFTVLPVLADYLFTVTDIDPRSRIATAIRRAGRDAKELAHQRAMG